MRTETYTDRCPFECIHVEKKWRRGDCVRMCVCVCALGFVCVCESRSEREAVNVKVKEKHAKERKSGLCVM